MAQKTYSFKATVWKYKADTGTAWHFITLPKDLAAEIKLLSAGKAAAWGSLRVSAKIGKTQWQTSLFPDRKSASYFRPVKAEVRKREGLADGSPVTCKVWRET